MRPINMDKLIKKLNLKASSELDARVHADISSLSAESDKAKTVLGEPNIWRMIMKSKITKLAAAAVIIIGVIFGLTTVLNKSVTPVYAIEQTIQAIHSVNYLHIKDYDPSQEEPKEVWVEFDPSGPVKNMRVYLPEWANGEGGPAVCVWKDNKVQIWLKKKNTLGVVADKLFAAQILRMVENVDPKLTVERLSQIRPDDKVKIDINQPSNKTEPIVVTATRLADGSDDLKLPDPNKFYDQREQYKMVTSPPGLPQNMRAKVFIDQATKLVTRVELYLLKGDTFQLGEILEYYDYNQPIEPKMFTLEGEVPSDATRIDQTTQEVGLVQGNLSSEEIAVEVARQFFEALIAQDYAKASKLYEGVPIEEMQKEFGRIKFIRIISIRKPVPSPETNGLRVPCVLEVEKDGKIKQWSPHGPFIRQVMGQPDRWTVIGGI